MQNQLPFRPTDNSSSTRLKYELEAEHWMRANKSVNLRNRKPDFQQSVGIVGAIITILVSALILICTFCWWILKWILSDKETPTNKD